MVADRQLRLYRMEKSLAAELLHSPHGGKPAGAWEEVTVEPAAAGQSGHIAVLRRFAQAVRSGREEELVAMGEDGHSAGLFPGPDLERAIAGPRERRAVGLRPEPMPDEAPVERVTLTVPALTSARAIMIVIAGAEKRRVLEQAIKEGPLSSAPIGRLLAAVDSPIDIFWSAEE